MLWLVLQASWWGKSRAGYTVVYWRTRRTQTRQDGGNKVRPHNRRESSTHFSKRWAGRIGIPFQRIVLIFKCTIVLHGQYLNYNPGSGKPTGKCPLLPQPLPGDVTSGWRGTAGRIISVVPALCPALVACGLSEIRIDLIPLAREIPRLDSTAVLMHRRQAVCCFYDSRVTGIFIGVQISPLAPGISLVRSALANVLWTRYC